MSPTAFVSRSPRVIESAFVRLLREDTNLDAGFRFTHRGPVQMKGKAEPMDVWYLNRASDVSANVDDDL